MRKFLLFLAVLCFLSATPLFAEEWFDIEIRIMTTGENQPQREIGIFGAELPLTGKGYLERSVVINNASRNKSNEIDFKISMKPERGEQGELHLIFTSRATPKTGKEENRFRDLVYDRPSGQIVEIFADPETGTHLLIALTLKTKEIKKELTADLRVLFKSRIEKLTPAGKELVDSFDLHSVGDAPVGRSLTHSVPVWVPGEAAGEVKIEGLKDLDTATSKVTVDPGEGFTYTPKVSKSEAAAKEKKKKKIDSRIPTMYQQEKDESGEKAPEPAEKKEEPQKAVESPGSYDWEKEQFGFEIRSEAEVGGSITATIKLTGSLYNQQTKTLDLLKAKEETRSFSNGDIATFTLADDAGSGYLLTIQAQF
jgi:hypothetical protein